MITTFISYGTKYDQYEGSKDWSDLTVEEQNKVIKSILSWDDDKIIETSLLKTQANGLKNIFVATAIQLEENGLIEEIIWNNELSFKISEFLNGTQIGERVVQALDNNLKNITILKGEDLEKVDDELYDEIALASDLKEAKQIIFNIFGIDYDNISYDQIRQLCERNKKIIFWVDKAIVCSHWPAFGINSSSVILATLGAYLGIIGAIFLFVQYTWYAPIPSLVLTSFCFKLAKNLMAQEIRKKALNNQDFFNVCKDKKIIWFTDVEQKYEQ